MSLSHVSTLYFILMCFLVAGITFYYIFKHRFLSVLHCLCLKNLKHWLMIFSSQVFKMPSRVHEEICRVPTSAVDGAEEQLERLPSPSAQYFPPLLGPGPKGLYIRGRQTAAHLLLHYLLGFQLSAEMSFTIY